MVNQQKGVQQETAYSAVVVNVIIICIPIPISFLTQKGHKNMENDIGTGIHIYYHSLQLHYRQYLVALLFADLPSLSPSFPEFYTCIFIT